MLDKRLLIGYNIIKNNERRSKSQENKKIKNRGKNYEKICMSRLRLCSRRR